MTFFSLAALAWVAAGVGAAPVENGGDIALSCADDSRAVEYTFAAPAARIRFDPSAGWVELEEVGNTVEFAKPSGENLNVTQPLRNAWRWARLVPGQDVVLRATEGGSRRFAVRLTVHCVVNDQLEKQLAWLRHASRICEQIDIPRDPAALVQELAEIDSLPASISDRTAGALRIHLRAEALAANGHAKDASDAFSLAEEAWLALDKKAFALAAHLGFAEERYAIADYSAVLSATPVVSSVHGVQSYLSVRLENPRCLALQALGRLDATTTCFKWELEQYRRLDERAEYVTVLQSYASVQRDRGNLKMADQLGRQALELAAGPYAPMIRGRLRLMLADIALRNGDVAGSLAQSGQALDEFASAGADSRRWRANTLINIAMLYRQLGAFDDAYLALGEAVRLLSLQDAPARMAVAMNVFADLESDRQHTMSARIWRLAAEHVYMTLRMVPATDATRALRLETLAEVGEFRELESVLAIRPHAEPLHAAQWELLHVNLLLHQSRFTDARSALDALYHQPVSLRDRIRLGLLEGEYYTLIGQPRRAEHVLRDLAQHVDLLGRNASSSILHLIIARQIQPLMRSAMQIALTPSSMGAHTERDLDDIWDWLTLAGRPTRHEARAYKSAEAFDRAVAAELLTTPTAIKSVGESAARRELVSLLAQPAGSRDTGNTAKSVISLAEIQRNLDGQSVFIAYLDGGARGGLLWITANQAVVLDAGAPREVREAAATLRKLLSSPDSSVGAIGTDAQTLAELIFGSVQDTSPPRHLLILNDELSSSVAWTALNWRGRQEPLIASTTVELVRLEPGATASGRDGSMPLRVMVTPSLETAADKLPPLPTASVEPELIRSVLPARTILVSEGAEVSRQGVLTALAAAGAWVHLGAHGMAQPQRIGYSGIWLPSETGPTLLSWLDILDSDVRADLVVLDACQLADRGVANDGILSFADAVSSGGANAVVAATWPVSDSAAALWVPQFYAALDVNAGHGVAEALRAAQQRLRASRAFSHPFYWAGLQVIVHAHDIK